MQPVKSPQQENHYDGRAADCREALEGKIQQLIEEGVRAGWSRSEVTQTLREIIEDDHTLLARQK